MKGLSVEEKAKRYDETIEQLKTMMPNWENLSYNGKTFLQDLVHIIPELKESKDERIRKWLICTLKSLNNSPVQIDGAYEMMLPAISWLEKQGSQNLANSAKTCKDKQKPTWSEGDESYLNTTIAYLNDAKEFKKTAENCINWLKSLKDRVKPQPKQEWSEENENRVNRLIAYFEDKESFTAEDDVVYANWLKSLKDRVQQQSKQEWSEEDKKMHDFAIRAIGLCKQYAINHQVNGYSNLPDVPKKYEELQDWLKSIKERYTWKPSDEQMDMLKIAVSTSNSIVLDSLYNDLMKLKE